MKLGDSGDHQGRVPYTRLAGPLIDQIPAAIALFDADLRCVMVNARWLSQFPFAAGDPVGRDCSDLFTNGCELLRGYLERAIAGEIFSSEPAAPNVPDARKTWFRSHVGPWRDTRGNVRGAMLVCENVTAEMEQTLRSKVLRKELSLFVDNAEGFALCMLDEEGKVTIWNSGAERLSGWSEAEALGQTYEFLFDPEEREQGVPLQQLELARRNGTFSDRVWRVRKDGVRFRADVMISRIEGDDLLPSGFGQILRDVSNEEFQARSLEANTVLLRAIMQTIPDALVVIDIEGRILLFSKAAEEMFGYEAREVMGRSVSMLMPERDRAAHDAYMSHYRRSGESRVMGRKRRLIGQRKDGTEFPHALQIAEAIGGGQRMIAGFMQDLSDEEATQAKLEELQRELAHMSRVHEMGTLASTIAHELNQPLMAVANIVQTAADILKKGDPASRMVLAEALEDAGRETLRAGDILRRLRVFLSRGELEKTLEEPCKLAEDAIYFEAAGARYRNIACAVECTTPGMPPILVDRVQIQQVILNLVKNAIQAVDADGRVVVRVVAQPDQMRFTVIDTGPGISPDRVKRLFEPFNTTKSEGMGLGLPICRSIIEAHGGTIWYEPAPGGGAAFVFTLPQYAEESDDAE
ncbi:PAS domain S-box protein [Erythrobacter sp. sf7]|uniref:histidine kinase n=1 Tax=Erythrobacter fulvus TaxID=2987523 RepID=A0ABT5JMJ2_9SPHN|nr:PAS domain S-box protein [Erythrobacter fulvus]MDC8753983.1 PAS domain S-box protein [Erythrobacter fulvus]